MVTSELNPNVWQGYFGEAFVNAIAAASGLEVSIPRLGHVLDFSIYRPGPRGTSGSRQINLQVKSWADGDVADDDHFHYQLEVSAYNRLAGEGHDVRHYLALCIVPGDARTYLNASHEKAVMLKAAYWLSLRDKTPDPSLKSNSKKTVLVPREQLLTPETLAALVDANEPGAVVQ